MGETIRYLNLTNGLEFLPMDDARYLRIESTACEQKDWERVLRSASDDLLMNLALGHDCVIYDCGKKGMTRAQWQGVEFIRYCCLRSWSPCPPRAEVLGLNVTSYFDEARRALPDSARRRLKYYRRYVTSPAVVRLRCVCKHSRLDGDYEAHVAMAKDVTPRRTTLEVA